MARVGQMLTAAHGIITDADGPDPLMLEYQWRRANDGSGGGAADISNEDSSTYTLTTDDAGKFIQTVVSYTDDGGTDESLESGWTEVLNSDPVGGPVTITGIARVGQELMATHGTIADADGPDPLMLEYQWRRANDGSGGGAADISNEDSPTYTPAREDLGKFIQVVVSYTDGGGNEESLDSGWTEVLNSGPDGKPMITGTLSAGMDATADTSGISDVDGPDQLVFTSYQWRRATSVTGAGDMEISGADSSTYPLTMEDEGNFLRVVVTYMDGGGKTETVQSDWTATAAAPQNSDPAGGPVTITTGTGMARVGQELMATHGTITDADGPDPLVLAYQWRRADDATGTGAADISNEASSTYTLATDDAGKFIQVVVSYTDDGGTDESLESDWTEVLNSDPAGGPPTITGTAQVGEELTAVPGTITDADGPDPLVLAYQWRRADDAAGTSNAVDIPNADSSTYTLAVADEGKFIQVVVSYTDGGGTDESLDSAWTGAVEPAPTSGILTIEKPDAIDEPLTGTANLTFTVTLVRPDGQEAAPVSVGYRFGGDATEGRDFEEHSDPQMLDFGASDTELDITVAVNSDIVVERGGETVVVTLVDPSGASLGTASSATGTINEPRGQIAIGTSPPVYEIEEETTTVSFSFSRLAAPAPTGGLDVQWRVDIGDDAESALGRSAGARATRDCPESPCTGMVTYREGKDLPDDPEVVAVFGTAVPAGREIQVQVRSASPTANIGVIPGTEDAARQTVDNDDAGGDWAVAGVRTVVSESPVELLHAVAGAGRTVATSIVDGIWRRAAARREGEMRSQATLGGRVLDTQALSSGDAGRTVREVASLLGLEATAPDASVGGLDSGYDGGIDDYRAWAGIPDSGRIADASSFALLLGDGADLGSIAIWGELSVTESESNPDSSTFAESESSDMLLGFDLPGGDGFLYGVAVSRSSGESKFSESSTGVATGAADTSLLTFAPYVHWTDPTGKSFWGSVGIGSGSLEMTAGGSATETDVGMTMLAAGAKSATMRRGKADFAVRGDVIRTAMDADGTAGFKELSTEASRIRVALERVSGRTLDSGAASSSRMELGARMDSGDGEDGAGLDVAAELRYASPNGLEVTGRLSSLLLHSQEGFSEFGVGLGVVYSTGGNGHGVSLSLEPTWNAPRSGVAESMWGARDLDDYTSSDVGATMRARLGYGVGTWWDKALATLYGETETGDASQRLRLGAEMRGLAGPLERVSLDVYGEREEGQSMRPSDSIMLEGSLGF